MGEPARVDPSSTVAERCAGQLVEDHHHHRRRATHLALSGRGLVRLGQDEVGDRRYEEEQPCYHEGRRRQHRQDAGRKPRSCVRRRTGGADREGGEHQQPAGAAGQLRQHLERDRCDQHADEHQVEHAPRRPERDQGGLAQDHQGRGKERGGEREHHDVDAGVPARDEELRLVGEHVEQRLRHREGPEHGEVKPGEQQLAGGRAARGRRLGVEGRSLSGHRRRINVTDLVRVRSHWAAPSAGPAGAAKDSRVAIRADQEVDPDLARVRAEYESSLSWRATRPLRALGRRARVLRTAAQSPQLRTRCPRAPATTPGSLTSTATASPGSTPPARTAVRGRTRPSPRSRRRPLGAAAHPAVRGLPQHPRAAARRARPGAAGDLERGQRSRAGRSERSLLHQAQRALRPPRRPVRCAESRVLDFGCGWGRLTRFWPATSSRAGSTAATPSSRSSTSAGTTASPRRSPARTSCPSGCRSTERFDLAFAFSVFTHLSEAAHERLPAGAPRLAEPRWAPRAHRSPARVPAPVAADAPAAGVALRAGPRRSRATSSSPTRPSRPPPVRRRGDDLRRDRDHPPLRSPSAGRLFELLDVDLLVGRPLPGDAHARGAELTW